MTEPQIVVKALGKQFDVAVRRPGLLGALRGLISRQYRTVTALRDVSFTINRGELVGYIGPNGAGKSTTIKILSGILVPTSGECRIDGRVPWLSRRDHVARIGVVFGQRTQLWWDLPVQESFELLRDIYRIPAAEYDQTLADLVATMDIADLLDIPVRQLSLGQRMRCDLVGSLLHRPDILFLDEPTIGLDAPSKLAIRDFVQRLNRDAGVTVILTTHDMDDIQALCERVIVIGGGELVHDGSLTELRRAFRPERRLRVEMAAPADISLPGVRVIGREGNTLELAYDPATVATDVVIQGVTAQCEVRDLLVQDPPIEELVAELYRGSHA